MSRFVRGCGSTNVAQPKTAVPQSDAELVGSSASIPSHVLGATITNEAADRIVRGQSLAEVARPLCGCRVEMAHYTCMNWGARHENEDRWLTHRDVLKPDATDMKAAAVPKLPGMESVPVDFYTVGVLDGHDTEAASDKVASLLPGVMSRLIKEKKLSVELAYVNAMAEIEDDLKKHVSTAGTCVLSCTIAGRYVWCSNLGDCRAALITLGTPKSPAGGAQVESLHWMSRDMKASAPHERARITRAGGVVVDGRVEGLEPSRTLGDFDVKMQVKKDVISIVPEVRCHAIGGGGIVRQALLVMATDGVWDVLSGQDVCDLIAARKEIGNLQASELAAANAGERSPDALPSAPRQGPAGRTSSKGHPAPAGRTGSSAAAVLWDLAEDMVQFSIAKGSRDDCTAVVSLISVFPA